MIKLFEWIKKLFKKNEIKMLQAPIQESITNNDKDKFLDQLKVNTYKNINKKRVRTLINDGDGLGIQTNFSA